MDALSADPLPMAKRKKPTASPTLYVGAWIRACQTTPAEVARKTGINEGYLSQIISGKKDNPSGAKLALIAAFLKIPLGDLYKAPPSPGLLDQIADFDPQVIVRLSQKRKKTG